MRLGVADWRKEVAAWKELGAGHLRLNTAFHVGHHKRIAGTSPADHIAAIGRYTESVSDVL